MNFGPHHDYMTIHALLIVIAIACCIGAIVMTQKLQLIAAALALFLLSLLVTGCTFSPDQAQAYANAAHTVTSNAIVDAKDAASVYNQVSDANP